MGQEDLRSYLVFYQEALRACFSDSEAMTHATACLPAGDFNRISRAFNDLPQHLRNDDLRDWLAAIYEINDCLQIKLALLGIQPAFLNEGRLSYHSADTLLLHDVLRLIVFPQYELKHALPMSLASNLVDHYSFKPDSYYLQLPVAYLSSDNPDPESDDKPFTPDEKLQLLFSLSAQDRDMTYRSLRMLFLNQAFCHHRQSRYRIKPCFLAMMIGLPCIIPIPKAQALLEKTFPMVMRMIPPSLRYANRCLDFEWITPDYHAVLSVEENVNAMIRTIDLLCRWLLPIACPGDYNAKLRQVGGIDCTLPDDALTMQGSCTRDEARIVLMEMLVLMRRQRVLSMFLPRQLVWLRARIHALKKLQLDAHHFPRYDFNRSRTQGVFAHLAMRDIGVLGLMAFAYVAMPYVLAFSVMTWAVLLALSVVMTVLWTCTSLLQNLLAVVFHPLMQVPSVVKPALSSRFSQGRSVASDKDITAARQWGHGLFGPLLARLGVMSQSSTGPA